VEHNGGALRNKDEEGGDRYYHDSSRSASEELDKVQEEIPADLHAMGLGGQNASKSAVAICLQDAAWIFLNIPLVRFHPSLPAFACEARLGGRVEWRKK
jgi:hypothetical protein